VPLASSAFRKKTADLGKEAVAGFHAEQIVIGLEPVDIEPPDHVAPSACAAIMRLVASKNRSRF
jgi:hypothetical protein